MIQSMLAELGLPNLHPLVVHYPIALVVVALAIDIIAVAFARRRWIARMGATLWVFAALSSFAAVRTGEDAEETVTVTTPEQDEAVEAHEHWAERTLWAVGAVAALRCRGEQLVGGRGGGEQRDGLVARRDVLEEGGCGGGGRVGHATTIAPGRPGATVKSRRRAAR